MSPGTDIGPGVRAAGKASTADYATPERLQRANSLFGGRAKRFQIVGYGGLNQ